MIATQIGLPARLPVATIRPVKRSVRLFVSVARKPIVNEKWLFRDVAYETKSNGINVAGISSS